MSDRAIVTYQRAPTRKPTRVLGLVVVRALAPRRLKSELERRTGARAETGPLGTGLVLRWLHMTESYSRVGGSVLPGGFPRNRIEATLRTGRNGLPTSRTVRAISGYANNDGSGRYAAWAGRDLAMWACMVRTISSSIFFCAPVLHVMALRCPYSTAEGAASLHHTVRFVLPHGVFLENVSER